VSVQVDEDVVGVTTENVLVFHAFDDAADRPTQPLPNRGQLVLPSCSWCSGGLRDWPRPYCTVHASRPFVDLEGARHATLLNPEGAIWA
jgi:hypothetical protein